MQLRALQEKNSIFASQAEKGKNYTCPGCFGIVRLRQGPFRQAHFYHIRERSEAACRLATKGPEHIAIQEKLRLCFPESELECPFPKIGRIADFYWPEEKLVIEIQCSPISKEQARSRTEDYLSLGLRLLWLLHTKTYNRRIVGKAERYLRLMGCFYTDINSAGKGNIWDQWEAFRGPYRIKKGNPLKVDLLHPRQTPNRSDIPQLLKMRSLYFPGDLYDRWSKKKFLPARPALRPLIPDLLRMLTRGYLILFRTLAEHIASRS